ncbi:MAG: DUF5018 domain-containing protein [Bacteroidales bacterium]|nr:DUF5018 domain-containing protein [Bacteroidales bacterium]
MKKIISIILPFAAMALLSTSCLFKEYPVDEDGLIITSREDCSVLKFDVLDTKDVSALTDEPAVIDTIGLTINGVIRVQADIRNLWPVLTLATDCKLDPKIRSRQDFTNPVQFTVVSGNRKIRKTYTVTLTQETK